MRPCFGTERYQESTCRNNYARLVLGYNHGLDGRLVYNYCTEIILIAEKPDQIADSYNNERENVENNEVKS